MFSEDLSAFFDTTELAVEVNFKGNIINVFFDQAYVEGLDVSGTSPVFRGVESQFIDIAQGDAVSINNNNYTVDDFQPDGTGLIQIILKLAS